MTGTGEHIVRSSNTTERLKSVLKSTKLYWGLALLFLVGVISSPVSSKGNNIFLSFGNLSDVFRQISVTGITAVGMTLVILIAGIDLSVGSVLALGSVVCAMLLTNEGWSSAYLLGVPAIFLLGFLVMFGVLTLGVKLQRRVTVGAAINSPSAQRLMLTIAALTALVLGLGVSLSSDGKAGVLLVLLVVPAVGFMLGTINGLIIVGGRLQPFIVTLAMMVAGLGIARLTAGQNTAVWPVYTGSNATADFEALRSLIFGIIPVPGVIFAGIILLFWVILKFTKFGRYIYAIGGNEEAARLAGVPVWRVKITVYAISGYLAALAGILYVAQYRQGKPDAGMGLELDAIAAVVIGGTSLMGGRGSMIGTLVGVLIFGFLSNILQLNNIDSNTQLVLKGVIIIIAVLLQERRSSGWLFFLSQLKARDTPDKQVSASINISRRPDD
ncbi:ABC transporter permease [Phyllobacterium endophyticum]|uniref:Sugar ABC transporter permease n=1 Tax=Phyllobacterium endophyticum TaxID=1149773 RepID=A0A2P7AUA9_9HYPH|nr:ABC transporter permease [Phyllobacterium endophyticum]MBB3234274.1 ribose/xylose/arabinose/galactoside ABC-type transport system permease subunit [Phyllobacterium endophyticum]PSH57814.1 sugar ABC transporter permease [Phyllobacterium endophyticum]TYR44016.1 ABC transporter permease [Phyllobacterium endophyticum]